MSTLIENRFRKLAVSTTLATFFLIFIGGLVRVSGAGLGCPDWPKCFGSWIPPLSAAQLPAGFNPQTFNFTLAWIEYINRLIGVVVGLMIVALAVMAIIYFRQYRRIIVPSVLTAILVAIQGWYGSIVVATKLQPITVSIHLVLALAIVSLLIYITQSITYLHHKPQAVNPVLKFGLMALWILSLVQIILGTQLRSATEHILASFPLLTGLEVLQRTGFINYMHSISGILLAAVLILFAFKMFATGNKELKTLAILSVLLILIQIIMGSALQLFGLPPMLQVFHLWIASIFIGLILFMYVELKYVAGDNDGKTK